MKTHKKQNIVKLTGMTKENKPATIQQADQVIYFSDGKHIRVERMTQFTAVLDTKKGRYQLVKHDTLNIFKGVCNGVKVHFTKKKVTGKLIYWS